LKQIEEDKIFLGNGSDEAIDLAFRIFCEPGVDSALEFTPSYGMYEVCAAMNDIRMIKIPLNNEFQIDLEKVNPYLEQEDLKLIFICSPNNPTGNLMRSQDIEYIAGKFEGIVLVDEAYIDFSPDGSIRNLLNEYGNIILLQTFSKAWGLAGIRIGMAFADPEVIGFYKKIKPPYNISVINQETVLRRLQDVDSFDSEVSEILSEKEKLIHRLGRIRSVKHVYPSDANFLLVEFNNADKIYEKLKSDRIIVRNRSNAVPNCLRITVGTEFENTRLIESLERIDDE
jgi:histidinol-phosphate aminotransferase